MTALTMESIDFPEVDEADWRARVEKGLKGRPFESLVTMAEDGFIYGPLYDRRAASPIGRVGSGPWRIVQRVDDPDPSRANRQALADLEGGANGLALVFAGSASAHGFGLPMEADAIARALDGVDLGIISLRIEPHMDARIAVEALRALTRSRNQDFDALAIDLCLDAVGPFAFTGSFPGTESAFRAHAGRATKALRASGFRGRIAEADGRLYHDAGATVAQELGAVLATALYYLRAMTDAGLTVGEAASAIGFTLAIDQCQFEQTAKLRALRLLWGKLLESCGENAPAPARIHAETSWRMMAAMDPHTNILRATIAAFAAGTGGADSLAVLPYTAPLGLPDGAARRLARNLQIILQEESFLAQVADPAAGSGSIEALTDLTAEAAWNMFREIEAEGGIVAGLTTGTLQSRIMGARLERQRRLEDGKTVVVGASLYPLETERDHTILPAARSKVSKADGDMRCEPLRPHPLSETLESSR
ncbi:methylmalonyl-CoA mutase subunit beta [Aurantimonas sp. A2-1-M11]|uniref:methylmalonyl-CoA mutase subunit beta n=1 Tax=Aurantimonas sp. A2-1-M11 TaxID=3113712 RepID=UPI002F935F87